MSVVVVVCNGCAERLELELTSKQGAACPNCERHHELCALMPCAVEGDTTSAINGPSTPALAIRSPHASHTPWSGIERVRAIEGLATTRLGVRELGRRTGFAPSTISRWLKIERCPPLKRALESGLVDIGRAKLLADAPTSALDELLPVAAAMSRPELAKRVAAVGGSTGAAPADDTPTADRRRLQHALQIMENRCKAW